MSEIISDEKKEFYLSLVGWYSSSATMDDGEIYWHNDKLNVYWRSAEVAYSIEMRKRENATK
jgi:hypothetical protein